MDPNTAAIVAIAVAAGSEIIALSPLKANSFVQLALRLLQMMYPKR